MRARVIAWPVGAALAIGQVIAAQQPVVASSDAVVEAASQTVGRALFLRCFCAQNELSFDAQGHLTSPSKATDWTLAGVNVQKVERKGPHSVELDGVRVAIRFATDRREFDRHPLNDEKVKIMVDDAGDAKAMTLALKNVFSTGIDRALQQAMPPYWQHYFAPALAWPQDALTGLAIQNIAAPTPTASVAIVTHHSDASYTTPATHDRVAGSVRLRLVVDVEGMPQRIVVQQPLGYGLDEKAVEALQKYRFTPAMVNGVAVPTNVTVSEDFEVVPTPH